MKSQIWELTQSDARGTQSNAKVTPKPPSRRPAGPLTSLPPPLGGCVPARPPSEPPQEGKAPTTPSCSPPIYRPSSMDVADDVPMALPNDAAGSKPAYLSLPSCVSTVKMWLERSPALTTFLPVQPGSVCWPPNGLYWSLSLAARDLRECPI